MNKKQIRTTHSLRVFGSDHTDLVHSTGVAPLAARPDKQCTALFGLRLILFLLPAVKRKPFAHARVSTLNTCRIFTL